MAAPNTCKLSGSRKPLALLGCWAGALEAMTAATSATGDTLVTIDRIDGTMLISLKSRDYFLIVV